MLGPNTGKIYFKSNRIVGNLGSWASVEYEDTFLFREGGEGVSSVGRSLQGKLPSHSFCLLKTESSFYLCGRQAFFYLQTAIV